MQTRVSAPSRAPQGRLRILQTTDLHMQLLDYDYFADRPDQSIGLIGLADQIAEMRHEENVATVLCDNGDLIQGNPLADYLATHLPENQPHPMIAALNKLNYDAMTLGNHEFDYGLDFLRTTLSKAAFPIVSANVTCRDGAALGTPFIVLDRKIVCDDGRQREIKIGITGFGPPQTCDSEDHLDSNTPQIGDIIQSAQIVVPKLRASGADIIIALCHSGIGAIEHLDRMENAALPLAKVEGINVVLLGHTHEAFPDPTIPNTEEADYARGLLHGKPAVMGTFCGKSLGVVDLDLSWDQGAWSIATHTVSLRHAQAPDVDESPLRQSLRALVAKPHQATIDMMRAPIAQTSIPIVSYFATVQPDLSQQLLARAMQQAINVALKDTVFDALPVLAAKSSFRFGGRSGLGHYIDIPAGPITLRDAAAIFPFADTLCAVRRTGKQLRLWLERSAAHYNQILPGVTDQPLINPQSAAYNCDTVFGLSYQIDLAQPARFNAHGVETDPQASRIRELVFDGRPVDDDDIFIVATNSFRAKGGGGFPPIAKDDVIYTSPTSVRDHLTDYLKVIGTVVEPVHATWSFAPIAGASATFASAPRAQQHQNGPITQIGARSDGFAAYRIQL